MHVIQLLQWSLTSHLPFCALELVSSDFGWLPSGAGVFSFLDSVGVSKLVGVVSATEGNWIDFQSTFNIVTIIIKYNWNWIGFGNMIHIMNNTNNKMNNNKYNKITFLIAQWHHWHNRTATGVDSIVRALGFTLWRVSQPISTGLQPIFEVILPISRQTISFGW